MIPSGITERCAPARGRFRWRNITGGGDRSGLTPGYGIDNGMTGALMWLESC